MRYVITETARGEAGGEGGGGGGTVGEAPFPPSTGLPAGARGQGGDGAFADRPSDGDLLPEVLGMVVCVRLLPPVLDPADPASSTRSSAGRGAGPSGLPIGMCDMRGGAGEPGGAALGVCLLLCVCVEVGGGEGAMPDHGSGRDGGGCTKGIPFIVLLGAMR
jgi:hypothetical protein